MWPRHVTTALTVLAVGAASALMAPGAAAAAAATCTPAGLPLPATTTDGTVDAADSGGGYAGTAYSSATYHAVRWSGGKVTDYGDLPGLSDTLTVKGVNRDGTVIGFTDDAQNKVHPFRSRDGKLEALPVPSFSPAMSAFPTAVNDSGDIVGWATGGQSGAPMVAVLWPASAPGTVVKVTGGLPATGQTKAVGIDQDGTVLVNSYPADNPVDGNAVYLWHAGSARKLAVPSGETTVQGSAVSNGRVAGQAGHHGILWDRDGTIVRPGNAEVLRSVNRTGQSVGFQPSSFEAPLVTGVWQLGTKTATLTGSDKTVKVSADNGTLAGSVRDFDTYRVTPTTWRCG
jgi:hypothetical protein